MWFPLPSSLDSCSAVHTWAPPAGTSGGLSWISCHRGISSEESENAVIRELEIGHYFLYYLLCNFTLKQSVTFTAMAANTKAVDLFVIPVLQ